MSEYRKSPQPLLPKTHTPTPPGVYDIYPAYPIGKGRIHHGFAALAERLAGQRRIVIDGDGGVLWQRFRSGLDHALRERGVEAQWVSAEDALRPPADIDALIEPYLGGDDPLFGKRFPGSLAEYFPFDQVGEIPTPTDRQPVIVFGTGASFFAGHAYRVWVDVPKNEIQYRARAGSIRNLGASAPDVPGRMYKRFYFVDWVVVNRHKEVLLPHLDLFVDAQDADSPALIEIDDLRRALAAISQTYCRVRPWFEPGPWGGQWMKERIPGLVKEGIPNYAWSFEMIAPEQGVILESGGKLLEFPFDVLMAYAAPAVLGAHSRRFGSQFPIRFDFLDTFGGGNLSLQCHPRPSYIRQHFGEDFTQDETYYILDCKPGAAVYLGFQEGIDPAQFRAELETSFAEGSPVDVDRFVQVHPSEKHGLYLIPNGTIHCSGADNLVLEISATPYIFTFKMYDWLRLDLEGKPRPLNIERAFHNLYFDRQGASVERDLIAQPRVLEEGEGWRRVHLPTHRSHFYDVHRLEFASAINVQTEGSPHLLMLVEGTSVMLETRGGARQRFNYAETFMIPAAAEAYRLINEGQEPAQVIVAFLKPGWTEPEE